MRIPIEATAHVPINRPDTYQRLPLSTHKLSCEMQPVHTKVPEPGLAQPTQFVSVWRGSNEKLSSERDLRFYGIRDEALSFDPFHDFADTFEFGFAFEAYDAPSRKAEKRKKTPYRPHRSQLN